MRCVQDFVALGSENCNAALVCLSSGSWITSSLRKIDFAAIFVLNLIQKNSQSTYASLLYHVKTEHVIERQIWIDASQIPPAKRTKVQSLFFLTPLMGGRARVWFMLCSPQWIAYLSTRFLQAVSSGTQCCRNTR